MTKWDRCNNVHSDIVLERQVDRAEMVGGADEERIGAVVAVWTVGESVSSGVYLSTIFVAGPAYLVCGEH